MNPLNPIDFGKILVALFVWRGLQDGTLDVNGCLRAGCLLVLVIGGVLLLIGLLATAR